MALNASIDSSNYVTIPAGEQTPVVSVTSGDMLYIKTASGSSELECLYS